MSLLNELENYVTEEVKNIKSIVDNDLAISCHSLIKSNDGKYKSDKQKRFIESKINKGSNVKTELPYDATGIIKSELSSTGITWVFMLDDVGVSKRIIQKYRLVDGKTREEVDRMYNNMTPKEREQNAGLEKEMMQDKWKYKSGGTHWERNE